MAKGEPTDNTLWLENRALRRELNAKTSQQVWRELLDLIRTLGKPAIMIGFPCWTLVEITQALAGENTGISIVANILTSLTVQTGLCITITVSGVWYGYRQSSLRKRAIASQDEYITELEKERDPNRSSSGLNSRGEPKDKESDDS